MGRMNGKRVTLEPVLEEEFGALRAAARRALARKLRRWARQLDVSAAILERDEAPPPKRRSPALPAHKCKLN